MAWGIFGRDSKRHREEVRRDLRTRMIPVLNGHLAPAPRRGPYHPLTPTPTRALAVPIRYCRRTSARTAVLAASDRLGHISIRVANSGSDPEISCTTGAPISCFLVS